MSKVVAPEVAAADLANPALVDPDVGDPAAEGVDVGAVFLARNRQQRRVWAIRDGRVHFFVRAPGGGAFWSPGHPPHLAPTIELFLTEVAERLAPGVHRKGPAPAPPLPSAHSPDRPIPPHKNAYR